MRFLKLLYFTLMLGFLAFPGQPLLYGQCAGSKDIDPELFSYKSKGGVAVLCGFEEFTTPSLPPKKYKTRVTSGGLNYSTWPSANCQTCGRFGTYPINWSGKNGGDLSDQKIYTVAGSMVVMPRYNASGAVIGSRVSFNFTANAPAWGVLGGYQSVSGETRDDWWPTGCFYPLQFGIKFNSNQSYSGFFILLDNLSWGGSAPLTAFEDTYDKIESHNANCQLAVEDDSSRVIIAGTPSAPLTQYVETVTKTERRKVAVEGCQTTGSVFHKSIGEIIESLVDEDTEAAAMQRVLAQAAVGSDGIAYREQRGAGDFDFGFNGFVATAEFETCPGDYLVTIYRGKRERGTQTWTLYEEYDFRRFDKPKEIVEVEVPIPGAGDLFEYTVFKITISSSSCTLAGAGTGFHNVASVHSELSMGAVDAIHSAGVLLLNKAAIGPAIYSPAALNYTGPGGSSIIVRRDAANALRQVKTPAVLADIITLTSPVQGYEVRFYSADQIGAPDPATGIFSTTGPSFVTHRFDNPDEAAVTSSLRITETRSGSVKTFLYSYDSASGTWSLNEGDGLRVTEQTSAIDLNGDTVKTRTIKTDAGIVSSVVATTYHTFPWGAEEKIKEVLDPAGAALTTTWIYYETSPAVDGANNYGRLKQRTDANGYWEIYTYDSAGRLAGIKAPHLDAAPGAPASACRVTEIDRTPLADADGDGIAEPMALTTVALLGQEISRSYEIEWTNPVTLGGDVCERVTTVRCAVPGSDWNAATNLRTETLRYASGDFKGRMRRELRPDGTGTLVTYSLNAGNGQLTTTTLDGQPNPAGTDILAGRRTLTVTNLQGQPVSEHVYRIEGTPTNFLLSSAVADPTQYDAFGRPGWIDYDDGTYETRTYACCGLKEERNREGSVTVYDYDALGRRTHTTRAGITLKTTYDAASRERRTQRYPEDDFSAAITVSETDYDLAGRVTATRDAAGRQTDIVETVSPSTRRTTTLTTLPGPVGERGTITEIRAADGQLLKRTGSATAAVAYGYGTADLADASLWGYTSQHFATTTETKLDSAGLATAEVVTTYSDALGRTIKTVYADDAAARSFYNNKGQLIRQTDPDGVQTLQEYNALGELSRTILDLNRDGLVTEVESFAGAGADRITKTTRSYLTRTDDSITTNIERTETQVWADQTSAAPTTLAIVDRSVDGLKTWSTTYGLTTRSVTTYGPAEGLRTETVTFPDDSTQVTVYQDGRLQSVTRDSANVQISSVSYGYDDHGRTETVTDARTGTTTYAYYPGTDDLQSVTTPDPDATRSGPGYDSQATEYTEYDEAGRVTLVTLPDDTQTHTTYWPGGQVKRTWGSGVYPSEYTYDAQGRVKTLTTWQDFAVPAGAATTTWDYDPERGWLIGKRYHDNSGPAYDYYPSGRLKTRDWARTLPASSTRLRTTYTYNDAGDLWTVTYNDTAAARPTPPVTQTYDRLGRPLNTSDAAGLLTRSYQNGRLDDEVYSGAGLLSGQSVSRVQDNLQRLQTLQTGASSLGVVDIGYTYDGASRLQTVTRGTLAATYGYLANSSLIESVTLKEGSATRLTATRIYDKLNRLTSVTNVGASATRAAAYEFDDANRRQRLTREDNAYWDFDYDPLGQVTGATKRRADAAALPGHAFAFDYDDIGNRLTATANARTSTYGPTLLNQYAQRTVPGAIDVSGQAQAAATVTVNNQPTQRLGDLFHGTATADNSAAPQYVTATVVGVKNNVGANGEDAVSEVTRQAFLAKTPEVFSYDADGNLGADGRWSYEWDAENRLVAMETLPAVAAPTGPMPAAERRRLEFAYDATGRRIRKVVKTWDGSAYATASELRFLYDGWNLVAELGWNTSTSSYSLKSSHVWGLDLSGTAQGAGGVGGLLMSATSSAVYAAAYDGNGNVLALYNAASGAIAAEYEYGPFGEVLKSDGTAVEANPFGFSTKYRDVETGLNYYGFRYYTPSIGRWLSRDPIEEQGGANLYVLVGNNAIGGFDFLGWKLYGERLDEWGAKALACALRKWITTARVGNFLADPFMDEDFALALDTMEHYLDKTGTTFTIPSDILRNDHGIGLANEEARLHFLSGALVPYQTKSGTVSASGPAHYAIGRTTARYTMAVNMGSAGMIIDGELVNEEYTFSDTKGSGVNIPDLPLLSFIGVECCWFGGNKITDKWMEDLERYGYAKSFKVKGTWSFGWLAR